MRPTIPLGLLHSYNLNLCCLDYMIFLSKLESPGAVLTAAIADIFELFHGFSE